jgi:hypothetical protein
MVNRMPRYAVVPILIITIGSAPRLSAQRADSLRVGADIRVDRWQPTRQWYRGTYHSRDSLNFVLASPEDPRDLIAIPLRDLGGVEMLVGRRTAGAAFRRGAGRGALVGLAASAVMMTVGLISDQQEQDDVFIPATAVAGALSVLTTGVTTLVGGLIGVANRNQWQTVPFRP